MNIAIIGALAKTKSTGKIAYGLFKWLLERGHNTTLFYGRKDEVEADNNIVRIGTDVDNYYHFAMSRLFGNQGAYSKLATKKLIHEMDARNIQAVYILNLHGYYLNLRLFFDYLSKKKIKIIYIMVDESSFRAKCCAANDCVKYQTLCEKCPLKKEYPKSLFFDRSKELFKEKRNAYKKNNITFVGIKFTVDAAKKSAIIENGKFEYIDEAVNTKEIYFPRKTEDIRKKLEISSEKIVIMGMGPYSNYAKGGRFILEAARKLENDERFIFVFPGFDGDRNKCPKNFIPLDYVKNPNDMAELYSLADLFVCTSYSETIANTCLEALACGTRLLVFNACGMPECAEDAQRTVLEIGDVEGIVTVVKNTIKKDKESIQECRDYAVKRYDSQVYFEKLEKLVMN